MSVSASGALMVGFKNHLEPKPSSLINEYKKPIQDNNIIFDGKINLKPIQHQSKLSLIG